MILDGRAVQSFILDSGIGFERIKEQPILKEGRVLGWHSYCFSDSNYPISGGTHPRREIARRIAIAEALERVVVEKLSRDQSLKDRFLLDEFPSSSGFAAGFDDVTTKNRAICEGVERWAWSQWVDYEKGLIEENPLSVSMDPLSQYFMSQFDDTKFFSKDLTVSVSGRPFRFKFYVVIGLKGDGVFPGSRVTSGKLMGWDHGILEAWRNLNNFEVSQKNSNEEAKNWLSERVKYYGRNGKKALERISQIQNQSWPEGQIRLLSAVPLELQNVHVWRCLLRDFLPWQTGDETRFVI